jgi:hypothetical protein
MVIAPYGFKPNVSPLAHPPWLLPRSSEKSRASALPARPREAAHESPPALGLRGPLDRVGGLHDGAKSAVDRLGAHLAHYRRAAPGLQAGVRLFWSGSDDGSDASWMQFPALAMVAEVVVRAEGGPSGMRRPMPSAERMRGDPNMEQFRTLARSRSNGAAPFRLMQALGTRYPITFRGHLPTARSLARLRFNGPVAATAARLATEPAGLGPGRAGFAPTGRRFRISRTHRPLLPDQQCLVATHHRSSRAA